MRSAFAGVSVVLLAMIFSAATPASSEEQKCPQNDSGLSLPDGFCATIFADKIGHARQLAVTTDDTVYVNTWSGAYYNNDTPPPGGFLIALKDTRGTGHADVTVRFGPTFAEGAHGGTGIWLYKHWLYDEIDFGSVGVFQHEILLSDGRVLSIRFTAFDMLPGSSTKLAAKPVRRRRAVPA